MNDTKAALFDTSSRLLHELYHIHITLINDSTDITHFVSRHRFHPLQAYLSGKVLAQLMSEADKNRLHVLTDVFMVQVILFFIDDTPVIFGPYSALILTERDARTLIARHNPEQLSEQDLLYYVGSSPHMTETDAIRIISSMLHLIDPAAPAKVVANIDFQKTAYSGDDVTYQSGENYIRLLEKRYDYEQRFLRDITAGNTRSALMNLQNMQIDVAHLKRIGTTLENERIGAAITRTTVRIAAIQAGLPPIIVDRISAVHAAATRSARTVAEIFTAKEAMVRDFCKAIHEHRNNHYSALVQSCIYYIEHEYFKNISLQMLANNLDVTKNHLIATFRKETGTTPNVYLRSTRLRQAAALLAGTNRPVQEIADSVGIPDANYFIKCFRGEYGVTPLNYRKNLRV